MPDAGADSPAAAGSPLVVEMASVEFDTEDENPMGCDYDLSSLD